jgi:hypothetical protein
MKGKEKPGHPTARSATPTRAQRTRREKTTLLIVCEGKETEPNYLDALKREATAQQQYAVTVKRGKGGSRTQIVQAALNRKNNSDDKYDEVWCVMDVEVSNDPQHPVNLAAAVKLAKQHEVTLCLSNPSFEVWLLAHFERTAKAFNGSLPVIQALNKHWRKCYAQEYHKEDGQIYRRLSDRTQDAVANAQWVRENHHRAIADICQCNSSTEVYRLVRKLLEQRE